MLLFSKDRFKFIIHHQREIVQLPDLSDLLIMLMESNDNEGRRVTVVDIPPSLPSRSSSFYNGNGRSLVGSSMEGEEPAMSAPGSVATRVASRPPMR